MASIDDLQARTVLAMRDGCVVYRSVSIIRIGHAYRFFFHTGNPYVTVNVTDLVPGDIVHLHAGEVEQF